MTDEIRHTYTFITDTNVVMPRSHYEQLVKERDALKARVASMMESMSMSCEEPPAKCECAGCSYAREKGGDV